MRKIMLIAGLAKQIPRIEGMDYVGIDHGALVCMQQGIPMLMAVGDFDSVSQEEYASLCVYTDVKKLPAHKNETDSEEALRYAMEQGYDEIILFGGLGGRIDHELANIHMMIYRNLPIILMDEQNILQVINTGHYHIAKQHKYLSFLALEESCITETNVAYPLQKRRLLPSDIYSISNEFNESYAEITLHYGKMLMMQSDDKK